MICLNVAWLELKCCIGIIYGLIVLLYFDVCHRPVSISERLLIVQFDAPCIVSYCLFIVFFLNALVSQQSLIFGLLQICYLLINNL